MWWAKDCTFQHYLCFNSPQLVYLIVLLPLQKVSDAADVEEDE